MRQAIIVIAASIASGCAARQKPEAPPTPTVATRTDSLWGVTKLVRDSALYSDIRRNLGRLDSLIADAKRPRTPRS
jgi:hypothetical protein